VASLDPFEVTAGRAALGTELTPGRAAFGAAAPGAAPTEGEPVAPTDGPALGPLVVATAALAAPDAKHEHSSAALASATDVKTAARGHRVLPPQIARARPLIATSC